MQNLYQLLGLDKIEPRFKVVETIEKIAAGLYDYSNNGPVRIPVARTQTNKDERTISPEMATLRTLASHKIITYKYARVNITGDEPRHTKRTYRVFVTNRYVFEQLLLEIERSDNKFFDRSGKRPTVDNLIYYNPSSGKISANGVRGKLKRSSLYKNREIFNLLLRCTPEPAPREEILKILKLTSIKKYTDTDRTYGINDAVDSLRDVLDVKSDVLSLKQADGLHLNAIVVQVEKLPEDFRFTD